MVKVLFVCLGNICRSPTAEGVFKHLVEQQGLADKIFIDSCGTIDHHAGERPDPRMRKHALTRGYDLTSKARGLIADDLDTFDYVVTMDDSNYKNVLALSNADNNQKIIKMTDYCHNHDLTEVPDPYFGGAEGFELVLDLLEDGCEHLLATIKKDTGL